MRKLIFAMALAMAATSAHAGERKAKYEVVTQETPRAVLMCFLKGLADDPQVTEMDDGYVIVRRPAIGSMIGDPTVMRVRLTSTPDGTHVWFWTRQVFGKQADLGVIQACAKL